MGRYTYIKMHKQMMMMMMKKKKRKTGSKELVSCGDIIMEILLRLPAKSLLRFRWVCKYWFNLITDPFFVKMHLHHHHHVDAIIKQNPSVLMYSKTLMSDDANHYPSSLYHSLNCSDHHGDARSPIELKSLFPPPPFNSPHFEFDKGKYFCTSFNNRTKVLTCNGVLCLISERIDSHQQLIILWNPCTNEYKELPKCVIETPRHDDDDDDYYDDDYVYYGFGYDHTTNDYKLIRNATYISSGVGDGDGDGDDSGGGGGGAIVDVYTLGTNSWKRLENCPYTFVCPSANAIGAVILDNIYWLGLPPGSRRMSYLSAKFNLISFDVANEDYSLISTPFTSHVVILDKEDHCIPRLAAFNGCLHALNTYRNLNFLELWRMMKDYSVNKEGYSWSKLFTFSIFTIPCLSYPIFNCKVLGIQKNGEFLMSVDEINLVLYNSQNGTTRILGTISPGYCECNRATFIESLVSLNSGTNKETKIKTYKETKTSESGTKPKPPHQRALHVRAKKRRGTYKGKEEDT